MIHQPASYSQDGKTGECMLEASEIIQMHDNIIEIYAQRTRKPLWEIKRELERDCFISAEEAHAYGIVDMILESG